MEIWKDIKNYEHKYQVSNLGNLRIKENKFEKVNMGVVRTHTQKARPLKPTDNGTGYLKVGLIDKEGKRKNLYVHRLVALAFIPNPENKAQVNHIDGDKKNNNISNLEWSTESENMQHARHELGFVGNTDGINPPRAVLQINRDDGSIISEYSSLTEAFNKTRISHISCVCRGERNTAGGFKWRYKD